MTDSRASAFTALADRVEEEGYFFPDYDGYCFAAVPETALSPLSDEFDRRLPADVYDGVDTDVSQVVVLLLDGLGWDQWHRDVDYAPFLDAFDARGTVTPLTSVYPTETAAAITTMHTGQPPSQHGLLGWYQYVDGYDGLIQTLPFTTHDGEPLTDVVEDVDRSDLHEGRSLYPDAEAAGVDAHLYQPSSFEADTDGATDHPYYNVADAVAELRLDLDAAVAADDGPAYRYLYVPEIDALAHHVGTNHDRYRAQVRFVTEALRSELFDRLGAEAAAETLLVVTADHGLTDTDPETNVDLRETPVWDHVGDTLPAGAPRNVQFHVDDPEATAAALHETFGDDVLTVTREAYLERELFGAGTCETFERRAPDLVAVHRSKGMWWEEAGFVGMHGGLTREEMFVPFAAGRVADLRE